MRDDLMSVQVELVRANLVAKLREAGVVLPDQEAGAIADAVLDDAVRLALDWVEGRDQGWQGAPTLRPWPLSQ